MTVVLSFPGVPENTWSLAVCSKPCTVLGILATTSWGLGSWALPAPRHPEVSAAGLCLHPDILKTWQLGSVCTPTSWSPGSWTLPAPWNVGLPSIHPLASFHCALLIPLRPFSNLWSFPCPSFCFPVFGYPALLSSWPCLSLPHPPLPSHF